MRRIASVWAVLLAGVSSASLYARDEVRPNIIFIMADDLGQYALGCCGQENILTPRLDRMAAEGCFFDRCYAGAAVCAPSRCALITGMHMGHAHTYYPEYYWRNEEFQIAWGNMGGYEGQWIHDDFTRFALEFINENKEGPFFLYVPYTVPHD